MLGIGAKVLAVLFASLAFHTTANPHQPNPRAAIHWSHKVFKSHWRTARCVSYWESRDELAATNGANRGPWQINISAHPWVNAWRLTHQWRYSARVAFRLSAGGTNWSPWSTAARCGV